MEQYPEQLQELISWKQMLDARFQEYLRRKELYEREFKYWYKIISQENPGYWETRRAVKASDMMAALQTGFSFLKKELQLCAIASKEAKATIRAIQIQRSNLVS